MTILGLEPGAQIIILQGASTYAALASAWFFARPVLRGQATASSRSILAAIKSTQADIDALVKSAAEELDKSVIAEQPSAARDNRRGAGLLVVSLVLLTLAVILQI